LASPPDGRGVKCLCGEKAFESITFGFETGKKTSPTPSFKPIETTIKVKERSLRKKKKESLYHRIILRAAKRHRVDPALVKAIIMAESGYNAQAVSKRGASGLMQLMPNTAKALGVKNTLDPEHNVNGGVKYFRDLLDQFNDDVKLAVAAYNAGSSKVRKHRDVPPIRATQLYVKKVFEYYQYYKREMAEEMDNV
jgi:soluble lytic murein transglycosylase-like protein